MGYYHIKLDEESQKLCTIALPWGKYCYKRLPMGVKNSSDIFQEVMMSILGDLEFLRVYLDDIIILSSGDYNDHMEKVGIVLQKLKEAGFAVNLKKSFFAMEEIEYLGYIVSCNRVRP